MALDVEVPEPPDLSNRGMPRGFELQDETLGSEDFYREDLEDLLQEGAWKEGFNEWTEYTNLDEEQARIVSDLGLFQAFDFYWDQPKTAFESLPRRFRMAGGSETRLSRSIRVRFH